jgi:hypothetical protein
LTVSAGLPPLGAMRECLPLPWCGNRAFHQKNNSRLLAKAELLDNGFIAVGIVCLEIIEQAATLADQHEKTATRAVILLVRFKMLRQVANTFAQQSDLNFRAARIRGMRSVLVNK